jgi:hypothetical protein
MNHNRSHKWFIARGMSSIARWRASAVEAAVELGIDGVGISELVFEDDDAACRIERGAMVDQFTCPCRDSQLIAGVAAVSALGALGCE